MGAQRSQLLMLNPLPSVEMACAAMQQEESQNEVLSQGVMGDENVLAMYSKGNRDKVLMCTTCGRKGHTHDRCWEATGMYPKWHSRYKPGQKPAIRRWSGNKTDGAKVANNV